MPDQLTCTKGLPLEWIPIAMYNRAAKLLEKHTEKQPLVWAISSTSFLCMSEYGIEHKGHITKPLVKAYRAISGYNHTYHGISLRCAHR